ncbi:MAG: hypothetical protein K2P81_04680 [Bacteriovoracaceae bacterium]|nr:hypothetical protein [Bacteriovoracaceae bacterium]
MNHYELGKAAYEARQFLEADAHFARVDITTQAEVRDHYFLMLVECAKILREESCWREIRKYSDHLFNNKMWKELVEFLQLNQKYIPEINKSFYFEHLSAAAFERGEVHTSKTIAIKELSLLVEKKLTHKLLNQSSLYKQRFPHSLFFQIVFLQACVILENIAEAEKSYIKILEDINRKWIKIDDLAETSKIEILETINNVMSTLDTSNGESVLVNHFCHLQRKLLTTEGIPKEDWKKLIEVIVNDQSFKNLKLCLEVALMTNEVEILNECFSQIKKKKGYSFVKLTRYDSNLKKWALEKGGERKHQAEEFNDKVVLSEDDLKLLEPITQDEKSDLVSEDDRDEYKSVESNMIKQLELLSPNITQLPDLLVTYKMMGLNRVVGWLLNKFDTQEIDSESYKKIKYFQVIHSLDMGQKHLALAFIEEMLGRKDLTIDEFKELKYVEGSLYLKLGRKADGKNTLRIVEEMDPSYRLVRERVASIV